MKHIYNQKGGIYRSRRFIGFNNCWVFVQAMAWLVPRPFCSFFSFHIFLSRVYVSLEAFSYKDSTTLAIFFIVSKALSYVLSIGVSSNTTKHPAPWSNTPWKVLSKIICDNLTSTCCAGSLIISAIWEISTRENGSITRTKFCSNNLSYKEARWFLMMGSLPSSNWKEKTLSVHVISIDNEIWPVEKLQVRTRVYLHGR